MLSGFFKKNEKEELLPPATRSPLSLKEKIAMIDKIYSDFLKEIEMIEKERDEKIATILKGIDERKIHDILKKIEDKK